MNYEEKIEELKNILLDICRKHTVVRRDSIELKYDDENYSIRVKSFPLELEKELEQCKFYNRKGPIDYGEGNIEYDLYFNLPTEEYYLRMEINKNIYGINFTLRDLIREKEKLILENEIENLLEINEISNKIDTLQEKRELLRDELRELDNA